MHIIKKLSIIGLPALLLLASCNEVGRIDQIDENAPAPQAASVTKVENKPGGAVIHYSIPNDDNILGVKAVYERNGETCESMASRYVDSLVVEGFGDTAERKVTVYSVGKNGKLSSGSSVTINPTIPPVKTATFDIGATFGGLKVKLGNNPNNAALAIVIIQDTLLTDDGKPASEIEWEDLFTFHTSAQEITLNRRGLEAKRKLFGVYLRDRWGNLSDTIYRNLEPMEEIKLPTSSWKIFQLPTDSNEVHEGLWWLYTPEHLWDGIYHDPSYCYASKPGPRVIWWTFDMGYTAIFSRAQMFHRTYEVWSGSGVRHFQIWGSMDPNRDGSWDDSWYLLGDFEPFKPSGYDEDGLPGTITQEDRDYWENTNEFEFPEEKTDDIPDVMRPARYFRLKLLDTFETYAAYLNADPDFEMTSVVYVIGELVLYGQMPNKEEKELYFKAN